MNAEEQYRKAAEGAQPLEMTPWDFIAGATETDWIVEDLIPAGKQVHLFGGSGVGKSLLALHLALAVIEGTPAMVTYATQQGPVLWLDYENGAETTRERLESYGYTEYEWFEDKFHIRCYPDMEGLDTEKGAATLAATIDLYKPVLVVIDSMSLAVVGEENSSDTYRDFGRYTGQMLRDRGTANLLLDNTGKEAGRGSRGSSRKKDEADIQWGMEETSIDSYLLTNHKDRIGGCPKAIQVSKVYEDRLSWRNSRPQTITKKAAEIVKWIEANLERTPSSKKEARTLGVKGPNRSVQEAITWLKANSTKGYTKGTP